MANRLIPTSLVLAAMVLAGCGGSDGDGPGITFVRGVNAVADAPALEAGLTDYVVASSLAYPRATNYAVESFDGGSARRQLVVRPVLPDGGRGEPVLEQDVVLRRDTEATLVFAGSIEAMELLPVETPRRLRPLDGLFLQFAHAADTVGAVDVYATDPGTDLAGTAPLYRLEPRSWTESLEVPLADVRIRLTRADSLDVVFDSGTISIDDDPDRADGEQFLMTVIDTQTPGASPLKLIAATGNGGSVVIADEGALSGLRVVHAAADTPPFDVVAGDAFGSPLASNVAYRDATAMATAPRGTVNLNFTVPGSSTEFVFEEQVSLTADLDHTLWLVGRPDSLAAVSVGADRRSIGTEARLRLMHAAPDGEFFSLYLGETASDPPNEDDRKLIDLAYGAVSGYLALAPGDYVLTLTERFYTSLENRNDAEETITIGPLDLSLAGGDVVTLLVLPPETPGGPELLQIDDDTAP